MVLRACFCASRPPSPANDRPRREEAGSSCGRARTIATAHPAERISSKIHVKSNPSPYTRGDRGTRPTCAWGCGAPHGRGSSSASCLFRGEPSLRRGNSVCHGSAPNAGPRVACITQQGLPTLPGMAATGAGFAQFEERRANCSRLLERGATTKWAKPAPSLRVAGNIASSFVVVLGSGLATAVVLRLV